MLRIMGNEVWTAHDGLEAVKFAEEFLPDAVLLDIGLPKLNGHDAARRIRAKPWGRNMVVVAVTGWGQDEDKRRSLEAGATSTWSSLSTRWSWRNYWPVSTGADLTVLPSVAYS